MIEFLDKMIISVFGFGFFPKAPGTVTSIAVTPLLFFTYGLDNSLFFRVFLTLATFGIAWAFVIRYVSSHGAKDHSEITIDELLGMQITFLAGIGNPQNNSLSQRIIFALIGLLLFRYFDIFKPLIIGWIDRNMKTALGILLDDMVAGFFSLVGLQLIIHFFSA